MKKKLLYIMCGAVLGSSLGLVSCDNDFETPPMVIPSATWKATQTIGEVKSAYWKTDRNYVSTVGLTDDEQHVIVRGQVISSDKAGNIYQNLVIRQENGEAINVAVKTSSSWKLYNSARYGAYVVMDFTGLKIGAYNGLMQIGEEGVYNNAPSMTFMTEATFKAHFQADGLVGGKVDTLDVNMPQLADAKKTPEGLRLWQSQLVRFKEVYFEEPGKPFADVNGTATATNRYIKDKAGNKMLLRNSTKSTFATQPMPKGYGEVTGILSYFGTDWQLLLIDEAGCANFDGTDVVPPGPENALFSETFATSQGGFTIENVLMNDPVTYVWNHDATYKCMKASTFVNNSNHAAKSLLISPVIDLAKAKSNLLTFEHALAKFPDIDFAKQSCTVLAREEGTTEWKALPSPAYPAAPGWTFVGSGNVSLQAFAGKKIQIAFQYTSENDKGGTWEVKNVAVY